MPNNDTTVIIQVPGYNQTPKNVRNPADRGKDDISRQTISEEKDEVAADVDDAMHEMGLALGETDEDPQELNIAADVQRAERAHIEDDE